MTDQTPAPLDSRAEAVDQRLWTEFEKWENDAAKKGSGMTREQKTGATMMLMWLTERGHLTNEPNVEVGRLAEALDKINAIRNSIAGHQTINWSEHIYPLVAALNEAGFKGLPYPKARANVGTLHNEIERLRRIEVAARAVQNSDGIDTFTPVADNAWRELRRALSEGDGK